jgi:hypothetical protein
LKNYFMNSSTGKYLEMIDLLDFSPGQ